MPSQDQSAPKLLFVLSVADGELFNAMYMVMGSNFRTVFTLRDPSYSLNQSVLPGRSYRYENLSDLLAVIDAEMPHVVCLFSGYLLINDKTLNFQELDQLVEQLDRRGIKVMTSDPYLGLMSRLPVFDPHNPFEQLLSMPVKLVGMFLHGPQFPHLLFTASHLRSLKRVPHVYVVDPDEAGDVRRLAFFNPSIRRPAEEFCPPARPQDHGSAGTEAHWLFVMGTLEYWSQMKREEGPGFHELLAERLRETLAQGRRPVLIAPRPCIEALAADPSLSRCLLLYTCDFNRYLSLLIGAEYAFYWNIFSASILARLLNARPTFFFARGHLADASQQLFEKGMSRYYANARLTYLDQTHGLSLPELAGHAALQQEQLFNPILESVRHLPTPSDLIHQLLQDQA